MREDNIIQQLIELQIGFAELKNKQFTGTNQMVMRTFQTPNTYDWGGTLTYPSQTPYQKGRQITVTATAQNQDNLVADIVIEASKNASMIPLYTDADYERDVWNGNTASQLDVSIGSVYLSTAQSRMKRWDIFIIGANNQPVYIKTQIIANDVITLQVEQTL